MEKLDQYVKIAEAARFLGVSQNTLRAWATTGRIPVWVNHADNYRLFRIEDLEQFLERIGQLAQKPTKPRDARTTPNRETPPEVRLRSIPLDN